MAGEFDMRRMQEEAVRRAREMQARTRFPQQGRGRQGAASPPEREEQGAGSQIPAEPPQAAQAPISQPQMPPEAPSVPSEKEEETPSSGGLLENLFQDKEKTIILALLILLGSEEGGQNHELMFALLFLLM